ncbi:hypothetical protein M1525_00595 [Patescibacteria group bacterium]|nr:hypothetical protein [Patescibacteria group bacterium]
MKTKPKKSLSQFFLQDKKVLAKIAAGLGPIKDKVVIEIGGGRGDLSRFLIGAKKLIIYEVDSVLANFLKESFSGLKQIQVKNEDFLKADLEIFSHRYLLIGNIPYHLTGLILRRIINQKNFPQIVVLTLQKEYGEKILGQPKENFLSQWTRVFGSVQKLVVIKKGLFRPTPKVDSVAVAINFYPKPLLIQPEKFERFLKIIFCQPNRKIGKKLRLGVDEKFSHLRPHQLKFEELIEIYENNFKK